MASGQNDSNARRNVDGTERGHYYAVMHRMSKHPRRQWSWYGQDSSEKSQTNLPLYLWTCAKWDNIGLTHY